jgi:hypothetical protein
VQLQHAWRQAALEQLHVSQRGERVLAAWGHASAGVLGVGVGMGVWCACVPAVVVMCGVQGRRACQDVQAYLKTGPEAW